MLYLLKLIIVLSCVVLSVISQFENQYLGHHITLDEYNHLELACDTKLCLRDAQLLRLAVTQNKTIEPCDDFREFSMGQFIKLAALNERYDTTGFVNDLKLLNWERIRKVLAARTNENDIKPFKIAKNYYEKCINSDNIRTNGTAEILEYLRTLGGAPFIDSSWNEGGFSIEKLFQTETSRALLVYLNLQTKHCPHPHYKSKDIICLKFLTPSILSDVFIDYIVYMFKQLKIDEKLILSTGQQYNAYRQKQIDLSGINDTPVILKVSELNIHTNNTLNFLKIFNNQLSNEQQLTDDSEILIENQGKLLKLLELIKVTSIKTLADVFAFRLLLVNKHLFIVYPFDELEKVYKGTSKSKQRWEQCILHLSGNYGPALQALYAERYFNKEVQESALDFIKEVVRDIIGEVKNLDINEDAKLDVVKKLNTAHYIIGYPEEVLDLEKIKKFYDKLELNGTEGIVETYLKIESFNENIKNRPKSNWKKKLIEWSLQQEIKYYTDDNIIYIPPASIQYPYYHPNRSRFFNTATLFQQSAESLIQSTKDYLQEKWNIRRKSINSNNLAYNNYVNWEKSGGKDFQLPGFFLTNRQMFWVALAHKKYYKFHSHNNKDISRSHFQFQYFHLSFKNIKHFRESFNCSNMTADENKMYKDFKKESLILNQNKNKMD